MWCRSVSPIHKNLRAMVVCTIKCFGQKDFRGPRLFYSGLPITFRGPYFHENSSPGIPQSFMHRTAHNTGTSLYQSHSEMSTSDGRSEPQRLGPASCDPSSTCHDRCQPLTTIVLQKRVYLLPHFESCSMKVPLYKPAWKEGLLRSTLCQVPVNPTTCLSCDHAFDP